MVVVIYADKVAQLQVAGYAGSFTCDALHSTAISKEAKSVIGDHVKAGLVEQCSSMCLSNSETDSVCEPLA
jgi:hypothetical protein